MLNVVSFSGGKDSTAMLLMMLERKIHIDYIIFCDTGKEFPQMYTHISEVEKYIGRPITRLKAEKDFEYYLLTRTITKGINKGKNGYGWPSAMVRWCTGYLKVKLVENFLKELGEEHQKFVGIAFDEPKRIKDENYPLVKWKITEKMALQYCYEKGFRWSGLYEQFRRVSCWCCPLQPLAELKSLYIHYPELWQQLKEMDRKSYNQFRADYSVEDLEKKFKKEINYEKRKIMLF